MDTLFDFFHLILYTVNMLYAYRIHIQSAMREYLCAFFFVRFFPMMEKEETVNVAQSWRKKKKKPE